MKQEKNGILKNKKKFENYEIKEGNFEYDKFKKINLFEA